MNIVAKIGLVGSTVCGGAALYLAKKNEIDVDSIGVVRFGRAACTALRVAIDYKVLFYTFDNSHSDYAEALHKVHLSSALRLRDMCCKNGGAFIKVGQHLGSLEYLLPIEYVNTMKVLHDQAPQSDLKDLKAVIEKDLGKQVEEMFVEFDPKPLGAASLAQVHKAKLSDGRIVAVKIQHPKVKAHSYVDIKTMEFLVHAIGWAFPDFHYVWLAEETKKNLPIELDFLNEGQNCERIEKILRKFKFLKVPKIYWDLSSDRVLTMEYCEGGKVDNINYMKENNISVNEVTQRLGQLYSEMIFVQGYVHCDPHPGNVLVKKTKNGPQIILLDHGLYQNQEIKDNVGNYLVDISSILGRVPRQMLLLLKTNDVLRGIESSLKSHPSSASFINMSRCCIQAVTDWELALCRNWQCFLRTRLHQYIQLSRISLYSLYLWILNFPAGSLFKHKSQS